MRDSHTPQPAVVVGIDGSQAAIQAAVWAIDEAISREVPIRLVEVIPEHVEPAPLASVGNVRMELEYGETALRIASAAVEAAGKPVKVETAILQGDPAATLIAESRNAEMVCVGSVGIGRFARAFLGSTATDLAEAAHCPVAIIRTQHTRPKPRSPLIVVAIDESPDNEVVVEEAMKRRTCAMHRFSLSECRKKTRVTYPVTSCTDRCSAGVGATLASRFTPAPPEPKLPSSSPLWIKQSSSS